MSMPSSVKIQMTFSSLEMNIENIISVKNICMQYRNIALESKKKNISAQANTEQFTKLIFFINLH